MKPRRMYIKADRSPEEQARINEIREYYQRTRPSLDDLIAEGAIVQTLGEVLEERKRQLSKNKK